MARTISKGDVVVIPFPYTDLSATKTRPVLVTAYPRGTNVIVCQVTSQMARDDEYAVALNPVDFEEGSLPVASLVKTNMIMTLDVNKIQAKAGVLKEKKIREIEERIIQVFTA
ncbi:mRNA interferase MazF [Methanohalophilus levihalophilus]|uniref:type II toxin-antitoxin system PemK/MazF family toxin n=1 Tax=Methanohalophilus levihalophilus TaxID=1431282 RepID=UPI001AE972C4|nr:type II toxin-antitoxin system PemK/MazF family toxin [Methanohalophilus levihalophilus]MBP2029279.1 mRNA interferase MazF [Methanohalophilus levihalophilus]